MTKCLRYVRVCIEHDTTLLRGVMIMPDMDMIQATVQKAFDLAEQTNENFVLAVTAAYLAGIERGKQISATSAA